MTLKKVCMIALALALCVSLAPIGAAEPDGSGEEPTPDEGDGDLPCFVVDTTRSPPVVYQVPC